MLKKRLMLMFSAGIFALAFTACNDFEAREEQVEPEQKSNSDWKAGEPIYVWNKGRLEAARASIKADYYNSPYKAAHDKMVKAARALLTMTPPTVMDGIENRLIQPDSVPGATRNHFMNTSKYVHPIRVWNGTDSVDWFEYNEARGVNTDWKLYSSTPQDKLQSALVNLGLAYYFKPEEGFAQKAVELATAWYLDPSTRMLPNYEFGVIRPDKNVIGKYNPELAGLINCVNQTYAIAGLSLIRGSKAYTEQFDREMKAWVRELYNWLKTHKFGVAESNAKNNHSIGYDLYMLTFALFLDDQAEAQRIVSEFPSRRLDVQIRGNSPLAGAYPGQYVGELPYESRRESGYGYTQYCLKMMMEFINVAQAVDPDIYDHHNPADPGACLDNAVKFASSMLGKQREDWLALGFKQYEGTSFRSAQNSIAWIAYNAHWYSPNSGHMDAFELQKAQTGPTSGTFATSNVNYLTK